MWGSRIIDLANEEGGKKVGDVEIAGWAENLEMPDGEEWMVLSAEDVQRIMKEDGSEEEQVREMIANLERFMEGESGFEGIDDEFEDFESDEEELD